MSGKTGIQWTDRVWNPVTGCTRVSPGCDHCYAFQLHDQRHLAWKRGRWAGAPEQYHQPFSKVQLLPERLQDPLRWRKPSRVFVNSMSDLFHDDVPDEYVDRVFAVMALSPQHTFQVLTKRPERMRAYLADSAFRAEMVGITAESISSLDRYADMKARWPFPLSNCWLGVSAEDQQRWDERVPVLLETPAAVRFVSAEPLLGPVDLDEVRVLCSVCGHTRGPHQTGCGTNQPRLSWIIVGGESGPHARPCDVAWIRGIAGQCWVASVPCFVKQLGANVRDRNDSCFNGCCEGGWPDGVETTAEDTWQQGDPVRVRLRDRHGGDMAEWPEDLRVREFPGGARDD